MKTVVCSTRVIAEDLALCVEYAEANGFTINTRSKAVALAVSIAANSISKVFKPTRSADEVLSSIGFSIDNVSESIDIPPADPNDVEELKKLLGEK